MHFQTLKEVEDFLFYKLKQYARQGDAAYNPGLGTMYELMAEMDNPYQNFESVHVGGTNGKGSVSNILASSLRDQGAKTGLYTSPHIISYRERIQVDGELIEEQYIIDFFNRYIDRFVELRASFFEFTVALAFSYFAHKEVDIAVVEVGMGGLLDSTNILDPLCSVITNVGLDHQNSLGDNISEIASNKAGIIKEYRPCVIGRKQPEALPIFEDVAGAKNSPLYIASETYKLVQSERQADYLYLVYEHGSERLDIKSQLMGDYQKENIATVLTTVMLLESRYKGLKRSVVKVLEDFNKQSNFKGRWQKIQSDRQYILDVCHNVDGVSAALPALQREEFDNLVIVLALSSDKDYESIIDLLPLNSQLIFTQADSPRARDSRDLAAYAAQKQKQSVSFEKSNEALKYAQEISGDQDLVLIMGSLYLMGEIMPLLA